MKSIFIIELNFLYHHGLLNPGPELSENLPCCGKTYLLNIVLEKGFSGSQTNVLKAGLAEMLIPEFLIKSIIAG